MIIYLKKIGLEIYNNKYTKLWFILWLLNTINHGFVKGEIESSEIKVLKLVWSIASLIFFFSSIYLEIRILYEVTKFNNENLDISFSLFFRRLTILSLLYFVAVIIILFAGYMLISHNPTIGNFIEMITGKSTEQSIASSCVEIILDLLLVGFIASKNTEKLFHKVLFIFETEKLKKTLLLYAGSIFLNYLLIDSIETDLLSVKWLFSLSFKLINVLLLITMIRQWQEVRYGIAEPSR